MSDSAAKLHSLLRKLFDQGSDVLSAVVKTVDKENCTCDVTVDEMDLSEVRLKATIEPQKGYKVFPAVGSVVLIEKLSSEEFFVVMYSEVDEIKIENEDCTIQITDGVLIQKGDETAKKIIDDTLDQIKAVSAQLQLVVVAIGVTPDVPALQAIDAIIEQIKVRNAQLFK